MPWNRSYPIRLVHPHGRGDNYMLARQKAIVDGSPPRAWGQWSQVSDDEVLARFTPTGVGTINRHLPRHETHTVHPHGRGDNPYQRNAFVAAIGSPPRAWGQYRRRRLRAERGRFTPTGVGTIAVNAAWNARPAGSPPRAWGQSGLERPKARKGRFTPTGVGTISWDNGRLIYQAVHPHGRGDNKSVVFEIANARGSPPRAWGQLIG